MSRDVHPLFDLNGKIAMVTGGGSGLGRDFCEVLAEFGADIICLDIYKDRAEETCEMIKKYGHRALAIEADVAKYDQVQFVFKQLEATFGRLDILVNNAGVTISPCPIADLELDVWHRVININLHGTFFCMKEGLRVMMQRKKGSIINLASIMGVVAQDPDVGMPSPYVTSKAAVIGLTKQGAAEYGRYGIRVNAIAPGYHSGTRLAFDAGIKLTGEELRAREQLLASKAPMRRMGEVKELRGLLIYLASDASSFLTGQIIASDGGWTCV